jgi:hypothetical protein
VQKRHQKQQEQLQKRVPLQEQLQKRELLQELAQEQVPALQSCHTQPGQQQR